jgi:hypothetical protein
MEQANAKTEKAIDAHKSLCINRSRGLIAPGLGNREFGQVWFLKGL